LRRQNELVAEAHAAITAEVADNAERPDDAMLSLDAVQATLYEMLQAIGEVLVNGATTRTCGDFGLIMPRLTRASRESAGRTNALGYMDYAQVREFASLFSEQDAVLAAQADSLGRFQPEKSRETGAPSAADRQRALSLERNAASGYSRSTSRSASAAELRPLIRTILWKDNVFIERFWRTLKYEEVYLRAYETVSAARESIAKYLAFYNARRPHTANDGLTPDAA